MEIQVINLMFWFHSREKFASSLGNYCSHVKVDYGSSARTVYAVTSGRGLICREALRFLVESIWKKMTFTWTREQQGNKGNNIYWWYSLFQAAHTTVFVWQVPLEKAGVGTVWLQTAVRADKSCHSLSVYRAPDIVINALQHFFQRCDSHRHFSSPDLVSDRVRGLLLEPF